MSMDIKQIVLDLCAMNDEQEWFEFKENWFQPETLGVVQRIRCTSSMQIKCA